MSQEATSLPTALSLRGHPIGDGDLNWSPASGQRHRSQQTPAPAPGPPALRCNHALCLHVTSSGGRVRCLLFAAGPLTHANLHLPLCLLTVRTLDPREVTGVMLGHRARQGQAALGSVWPTLILLRVPCVCACMLVEHCECVCMCGWRGWGGGPGLSPSGVLGSVRRASGPALHQVRGADQPWPLLHHRNPHNVPRRPRPT